MMENELRINSREIFPREPQIAFSSSSGLPLVVNLRAQK